MLRTHSGRSLRFFRVLVSLSKPKVIVQPKAQKEEIGARLGVPSSFSELINATGLPKYRIFGAMDLNRESVCVLSMEH